MSEREEMERLAKLAWPWTGPVTDEFGDPLVVRASPGDVRICHEYEDEGGMHITHPERAAGATLAALRVLAGEEDPAVTQLSAELEQARAELDALARERQFAQHRAEAAEAEAARLRDVVQSAREMLFNGNASFAMRQLTDALSTPPEPAKPAPATTTVRLLDDAERLLRACGVTNVQLNRPGSVDLRMVDPHDGRVHEAEDETLGFHLAGTASMLKAEGISWLREVLDDAERRYAAGLVPVSDYAEREIARIRAAKPAPAAGAVGVERLRELAEELRNLESLSARAKSTQRNFGMADAYGAAAALVEALANEAAADGEG
jgi:hypothetical protein